MELKELKIEDIRISGMNPRKTIDEAGIKELAENIRRQGLIQPVTVRPVYQDEVVDGEVISIPTCYELVCGERRLRAVKSLGRAKIAGYVREMTDDEAFDAMITENLQRQDVDPMEEAFAFQQLNERGQSAEDIAARFGKSVRFVQDRIKLNGLIDDLKEAVKEERLPISGAMLLAKLDQELQKSFYHDKLSNGKWSVGKYDVSLWVGNRFLDLNFAPWKGDDCVEGHKSCRVCEFNTANQGCLFYEMKGETAKCTNRKCYERKCIDYVLWKVEHSPKPFVKEEDGDTFWNLRKKGRRLLVTTENYNGDETVNELYNKLKERGYSLFSEDRLRRCWYDEDDDRLQKKIDKGEVFEAVRVNWYSSVKWESLCFWYPNDSVKGGESSVISDNVSPLINKYRRNEEQLCEKRFDTFKSKIMDDKLFERGGELSDTERKAFDLLIYDRLDVMKRRFINEDANMAEFIGMVQSGDYDRNKLMRLFIGDMVRNLYGKARGVLDMLMEEYIPEEFAEYKEQQRKSYEKRQSKIAAQLAELGYDVNGKKIEKS